MKQIFTLFFIISCSFAVSQAQVTLTKETHGFNPDQTHQSQQVEYQAPGESGQNIVWDFSQIKQAGDIKSSTDFSIEPGSGFIKAFRSDDQVTFYYNTSDRGNEYWGYERGHLKTILAKPILKTVYPQAFGTFFEGTYDGEYAYAAEKSLPLSGTYSTHADATGTIILPDGKSYPTLRIHTTQTTDIAGSVSLIEKYLWYTQDQQMPLFVSIQTFRLKKDGSKTLQSQNSYYAPGLKSASDVTGINTDSSMEYKVLPNPFRGNLEVSYVLPKETKVIIDLYDSRGSKLTTLVSQTQSGSVSFTKDVSKYTSAQGTYFLKMQFGDKVYTEKLLRK